MKCRSVACIWPDSPPVHRVTATAVLNHPSTLYTGGADGSIIWWNLPASTQSNQEVKPIAMLCGHAAPIADFGICFPTAVLGDGKFNDSDNIPSISNSNNCGALISACKDGTLCVWSRVSGHCSRRRKMPPWVGSPSMVQPLHENRRYVCIACSNAASVHLSDHQLVEGDDESLIDGESHYAKPSKCTVVIIDSYTLAIVQTVFHGNLSIGPLKSMSIILSTGHTEKQSVMLIDSFSKVQFLPILRDSDLNGENATGMQESSSHMEIRDWSDESEQRGLLVACASRGQVLVLVYTTLCIFRLVDDGNKIGQILFLDDQLCLGKSHIIGGMLLGDDDTGSALNSGEFGDVFSEDLVVWNNIGSAAVYRISYSSKKFKFEPLFVVPAVSHPPDVNSSVSFVHAKDYLLCVESIGFHIEEPLFWRPHITVWLLPQQPDNKLKISGECKRLCEGGFFYDWILTSTSRAEVSRHGISLTETGLKDESISLQKSSSCSSNFENTPANKDRYLFNQKDKFVSSSIVISENWFSSFAVVYGFYNGDIEVVRFDMFIEGLGSNGSPHHEANSPAFRQCLSGHMGAVICLAAHRMVMTTKFYFNHVLVSGSMDCTVRIWDLDSSNPVIVLHQHVAPVRQIILPPPCTECPWSNCFLSVAEDSCVSLTSLDTLQVERMFPGHPYYPAKVVWDSARGYVACLCPNRSGIADTFDVLYIWDVKTGARERVIHGSAAHSMLDHFCAGIKKEASFGPKTGNTSVSSLVLPITEETSSSQPHLKYPGKGFSSSKTVPVSAIMTESKRYQAHPIKGTIVESVQSTVPVFRSNKPAIEGSCPFPGIATLCFDLKSMMSLCQGHEFFKTGNVDLKNTHAEAIGVETSKDGAREKGDVQFEDQVTEIPSPHPVSVDGTSDLNGTSSGIKADYDWVRSLEDCLLQFCLSFLHLWNVDYELDNLLVTEMKLKRPEFFNVASGLIGDRGSLTLTFPGSYATLELWKSSPEYCATRSLTMVSLAQHMISLSHSYTSSSSALAAFYTRNFAAKIPDIKPPLLQLLVSFWQDEFEHVKMAARSLFHCAASRAIPSPLCGQKANAQASFDDSLNGLADQEHENPNNQKVSNCFDRQPETQEDSQTEESDIVSWLESFEKQDWISCVGGTSQDGMTSHVIVAAALAVWYPSLVKPSLAMLTVHSLMKLVMAMNEKYSSTAAEILAEGMESTWKTCIGSEIPHLIGDIFFQIECVSGASAKAPAQNLATSLNIKETLVGILLPSLAMADIPGFLHVIESQIWSTASDSPVHVVALMALIRVVRGSPRHLALYLDKVVTFILQTMDPSDTVMRRTCIHSSMAALKELVRVFPMVMLNDSSTRLAVGDAIAEINNAIIRVYDMQSMTKIKVLDASGPLGLPSLLGGASERGVTTAISVLSFSLDGEGLVAFSENGLMIRWWSLGYVWWEKISRNLTPVQCTKVIFVPPWEGFSPSSTRSSIMASIMSNVGQFSSQENRKASGEIDKLKLLIHNLDLSYRLEWVSERKVKLTQHGQELGIFQL